MEKEDVTPDISDHLKPGRKSVSHRMFVVTALTTLFLSVVYFSSLTSTLRATRRPKINHGTRKEYVIQKLPMSVRRFFLVRGTPEANRREKENAIQPGIIDVVGRPDRKNSTYIELMIICSGVHAYRPLEAAGCVVSSDVYEVLYQQKNTVSCLVKRPIARNERISMLFEKAVVHKLMDMKEDENRKIKYAVEHDRFVEVKQKLRTHFELDPPMSKYMMLAQNYRLAYNTKDVLPKASFLYTRKPRFALCLINQVRGYRELLKPWIDYHRKVGVDYIMLLDNRDHTNLADEFRGRDDIDVFYWPWHRTQPESFTYALVQLRHRCEAVAIHDIDEYEMAGIGNRSERASRRPMNLYTRNAWSQGFGTIQYQQWNLGNSGRLTIPKRPAPEVYIHLIAENPISGYTKSIHRTDIEWTQSYVHFCTSRGPVAVLPPTGKDLGHPVELDDPTAIVHYYHRAYEQMLHKRNNGSNNAWDNRPDSVEAIKPDYDEPPEEYRTVNGSLRYTFFRKVWRAVTKEGSDAVQMVVQWRGRRRCERMYNWRLRRWASEESCEEDFGRHGKYSSEGDEDDDGREE